MRESNVSIVWNNKASVTINTVLYDRRALDCDSEMSLMNSLSHLVYLTSTSPKIREILTMDGGLMRLMNILRAGRGQTFARMTIWQLALQCVVNVGIRGSEAIRIRVVEAGIVPIVVTLLDDFLFALESVVSHHSRFQFSLTPSTTPPPSSAPAPFPINSNISNSLDSVSQHNSSADSLFVNGDVPSPFGASTASSSSRRVYSVDLRDSGDVQLPNQSTFRHSVNRDLLGSSSTISHDRSSGSIYSNDSFQDPRVQANSPLTIQRISSAAPSTPTSTENVNSNMTTPSSPSYSRQTGPASETINDEIDSPNFFFPTPLNIMTTTQDSSRDVQLSLNNVQSQALNNRQRRNQLLPGVPSTSALLDGRRPENVVDYHGIASFFDNFDKKINKLPREEDILFGLQILAYTSKNYFHMRPYFESSKDVPSLRMSPLRSGSKTWNIFQLVEQFTLKFYPPQVQYWARAIMNNYCRKDESHGGIRRCANLLCNKWEEHSRQFAKCRRCRRTKYCSKECQHQAWPGHSRWCRVIHKDGRNSKRESSKINSVTESESTASPAASVIPVGTESVTSSTQSDSRL
ncbi:MYND-type zinc finger protein C31F10.10c [Schizosaccharomyces pombe]